MKRFATAALALASLATVASAATTVNMSFTGSNVVGDVSTGSGSFTYSGSGPSIGLSDITSFSFTTSRDIPSLGFVSTFTYGLSDLQSLTGTVDAGGNVVTLDFMTNLLQPSSTNGFSRDYGFRTAGADFGAVYKPDIDFGGIRDEIPGTMTYSTVPTPGAIGVLAGAGLFAARRRR